MTRLLDKPRTACKRWWFYFRHDLGEILNREAPSDQTWHALLDLCDEHEEDIDLVENDQLTIEAPNYRTANRLYRVRRYLDDVNNGPLIETRLGKWLYATLDFPTRGGR